VALWLRSRPSPRSLISRDKRSFIDPSIDPLLITRFIDFAITESTEPPSCSLPRPPDLHADRRANRVLTRELKQSLLLLF
jgi:hypothetical protein